MATLNAICTGIAKTIANYAQLTVFTAGSIPDMTNFPAVMCEPIQPSVSYAGTFEAHWTTSEFKGSFGNGTDMWYIGCYILCSSDSNPTAAQNQLNEFITGYGPNSIRQIIHDHGDLGLGGDTTATPVGVSHYGGNFSSAAVKAVGALFTIRVITEANNSNPFGTN